MDISLNEVELGFAINLKTLREVLKELNIEGKQWWIANDPQEAVENGALLSAMAIPGCTDRLNTLTFRIPVLSDEIPRGGSQRIVLLLDPSVVSSGGCGYYIEDGMVMQDVLEDFASFYYPIKRALVARLQKQH